MVSLQWFWHSLHTSRSVVMLMVSSASPVRMELAVWVTPSMTATCRSSEPLAGWALASACCSEPSALTCTSRWSASSS